MNYLSIAVTTGIRDHASKELMKKFKTKTYDYKTSSTHVKLHFQWFRGGDVEVTLIVVKGAHFKNLSGFFSIAPTKKEALKKLQEFCLQYYNTSSHNFHQLIPWDDALKSVSFHDTPAVH